MKGALLSWIVVLAILAPTQFPWNRPAADGSFLLDPLAPYDDAVFHVGVARELTLGFPPQVPGLSGFPLGYHFGQGLVRAASLRFAGLEPYDAISRVDPALVSLALLLAFRALLARLGAPPLGILLGGLSLLATDFSFVFAQNPSASYWTDLLKGNLLLSLAYVNPLAPALAILVGCLIALSRYEAGEGSSWLVLSAALSAALPHFKVFLGAHLLLGVAIAAAARPEGRRIITALAVMIPAAVMTALLAVGQAAAAVTVTVAPFDLARITLESLDLPRVQGMAFVAWCGLWLFASLGLRWLGIAPAWRTLRAGSLAAGVVAGVALSAWPLGLLVRIAVADALPGQKVVNDAAYVVEQGGPLLWLFTALALASLAQSRGRVVALALTALAVPSTIQFAVRKATSPSHPVPAAMVRAVEALRRAARPGDVVMQRPAALYPPVPVLLANLRVPYERYTPFRTQFAPAQDLERRHETVFRFFRTEDPHEALSLARSLGARWLALYGTDRVRFDPGSMLEPLYEEEGARVYRIRDPAE